jgi:hypothetical protein
LFVDRNRARGAFIGAPGPVSRWRPCPDGSGLGLGLLE